MSRNNWNAHFSQSVNYSHDFIYVAKTKRWDSEKEVLYSYLYKWITYIARVCVMSKNKTVYYGHEIIATASIKKKLHGDYVYESSMKGFELR